MKKKTVKAVEPIKQEDAFPVSNAMPLMALGSDESSPTRRNRAATIDPSNKYANIMDGIMPFNKSKSGNCSIREIIELVQKCYFSYATLRNSVEILVDFSCSKLFFTGGSKLTREFFENYLAKIGINKLMPEFFREHYRSGNTFICRNDGKIAKEDLSKITQTYGGTKPKDTVTLPILYFLLNPADVEASFGPSYGNDIYYKIISDYQLAKLRHPRNPEDIELFNSLPDDVKQQIKAGSTYILMPLDPAKVTYIANQKQSYEPLAIPMFYPVLRDIDCRQEMRNIDLAVNRTMNQNLLLITMGSKETGTNTKALEAMQNLFTNPSVSKTLISDFTTEAKFVVPDIADFLSEEKYKEVNRSIAQSLNSILFSTNGGDEKFANSSIKLQIFVERLKSGRDIFLNEFLMPEIKRIAKILGFKSYPKACFTEINLKDELEFAKLYSRLWETGLLTADETLNAIESGRLPTAEESKESQVEFKTLKDKGFYPLQMSPPKDPATGTGGRPTGPGPKIPNKKVKPVGGNREGISYGFSMKMIQSNLLLAQEVEAKVEKELKKKFKLKDLAQNQLEIAKGIVNLIIANEDKENWLKSTSTYIESPLDTNTDRVREIQEIAAEHSIDDYLASILFVSKTEVPES